MQQWYCAMRWTTEVNATRADRPGGEGRGIPDRQGMVTMNPCMRREIAKRSGSVRRVCAFGLLLLQARRTGSAEAAR